MKTKTKGGSGRLVKVNQTASAIPARRSKGGRATVGKSSKDEQPAPSPTKRRRAIGHQTTKDQSLGGVEQIREGRRFNDARLGNVNPDTAGSGQSMHDAHRQSAAPASNESVVNGHRMLDIHVPHAIHDTEQKRGPESHSPFGSQMHQANGTARKTGEGKASRGVNTGRETPSSPPPNERGDGHRAHDSLSVPAASAILEPVLRRRTVIRFRMAMESQVLAFARSMLGYVPETKSDIPERAAALLAAIKAGEKALSPEKPNVVALVADMYAMMKPSILNLNAEQLRLEKEIRPLARELPIWPWCDKVRGLGELSVASLTVDGGCLWFVGTVSKVWKRLGLAVINGKAQGRPGANATKDDWITHGYSKVRRSRTWNVGASLLRSGSAYKAVYTARKEYETPRTQSKMHAHLRAQRYMEKRLVRDMWREWRRVLKLPGGEE